MELRSLIAVAFLACAAGACRKAVSGSPRQAASGVIVAPTERVRVEVLNATHVHGLARRATRYLRDRGFDVVSSGTTKEQRDTTLVLDRANHPVWAGRVARAFGGARVESRPDTLRYVDVTVLLGATWRPPAEPFYP